MSFFSTSATAPKRERPSRERPAQADHLEVNGDPGVGPQDSSPLPSLTGRQGLRYCKFSMTGIPGVRQAVLFPETIEFDADVASTVFTALKIPRPKLLIENCGTPMHPYYILTDEELGVSSFKSFQGSGPAGEEHGKMLRECLVRKLKAVTCAILSAAERTGSGTYHWLCPSSFDMLAAGARQGGPAGPLGIGGVHANDSLFQWKQSVDLFQAISDHAVPLDSAESFGEPVVLDGEFIAAAYDLTKPFSGSIIMDGAGDAILPPERRHPMSQWIFPHCDLYLMAHKVHTDGSADMVSRETNPDKYVYGVNTCLDPVKRHDVLAPCGTVFMSGRSSFTRLKIMQCIEAAVPTVVLNQTGGHANVVSQLLAMIVAVIRDDAGELADIVGEDNQSLVRRRLPVDRRLKLVSPQMMLAKALARACADPGPPCQLALPDVLQLLDLAAARPNVFLETIRVVDPMRDSPEFCLELLSSCFASTYTGTVELGASSAQADVLLQAWRTHQELSSTAGSLESRSMLFTTLGAFLSWIGIVIAVSYQSLESDDEGTSEEHVFLDIDVGTVLRCCNIVVPALGGLLLTIRSRFRFLENWTVCATACGEIVREIYCFRGGVGDYDVSVHPAAQDPGGAKEGGRAASAASAAKKARVLFAGRLDEIVGRVVSAGLKDTSVASLGSSSVTPAALPAYVSRALYGRRRPCCRPCRGRQQDTDSGGEEEEGEDFLRPIDAEQYFRSRVLRLIGCWQGEAPALARETDAGDLALFVCSCAASLMGAFGEHMWIPIILGLAGFIGTIASYKNARYRLIATNSALAGLRGLRLQWAALSAVDRRAPAFRQRLVAETEHYVLQVLTASTSTGASSKASSSDGADEDAPGKSEQQPQKKGAQKAGG